MLQVHYSNSVTVLADHLIDRLARRQDNPLSSRTVVVPHPEMGRWLARRMADRKGVCANIKFELPSACLWSWIAHRNPEMPAQNPLSTESLTLRLLAIFTDQPPAPVKNHLDGKDSMAALSLARQLAALFNQYLTYRHQWILDWESGGGASWQAGLWRQLDLAQTWHWARALKWLFELGHQERAGPDGATTLEVMALSSLAPDFLRAFAALAENAHISYYQWSPCAEYWGDIAGRKQPTAGPTDHLEIGNRLLGSLGCQLRDFSDLLLEYETSSDAHYRPLKHSGSLAKLQSEILNLTAPADQQAVTLDNIQLHVCHSRRREIEVCHDRLLDLFENNPDLKADEIQVLAPDISLYGADIDAVFGARLAARMSFRIIGSSKQVAGAANSCLVLLKAMLEPIGNRCLLELLAHPPVARCFRIDADARDLISNWIDAAGGYGEIDPAAESGGKFGWDAAAQRLLLGSILEDSLWQVDSIRPVGPIASSDLDLLGAFLELIDALTAAQQAAEQDRSLVDWCAWAGRVLARFLLLDVQGEYEKQIVSSAVERLRTRAGSSGFSAPIELRIFLRLLEPEVESLAAGAHGAPGGITFASASSQRLIPARVIYALGLNDGEFPATEAATELDLIASSPRRGDGSRRQDDRQIFLEWLCNTDDVLLLSYIGRDIRDNSVRAPSPLIGELLDYLGWGGATPAEHRAFEFQHPAQAFSRRYGRSPGLFTYQSNYVVDPVSKSRPGFLHQSLPEPASPDLSLSELIRFLVNPARQFLGQRLGAWLAIDRQPMDAMAPTGVNALAAFILKQALIAQQLDGWAPEQSKAWALSGVAVPDTPLGHAAVDALLYLSAKTAAQVDCLIADSTSRGLRASLPLAAGILTGQVAELFGQTRVVFRAGKARSKVFLQLWLEHLFCNAIETPVVGGITSIAVCQDQQIEMHPVDNAAQLLNTLVGFYQAGQTQFLPLIPEASRAFAMKFNQGEQLALKAAAQALNSTEHRRGDDAEVHIARMLAAGLELDADFQRRALTVWRPLLDHLR